MLQALRLAIPASLDDATGAQDAYHTQESLLIARANGTPPESSPKRRWSPSKRQPATTKAPLPSQIR